ncbi:MAG: DNA-directed RNA polymerase subunit D [Thermoplasmata archaeon]
MNIKILEDQERYIKFEITNINYSIANMLRRTLINDIPKLAIDKVKFHHGRLQDQDKNSYDSITPLFDEVISLRLGLVPLPTDLKMKFKKECSHPADQSCPSCTVAYYLNKFGPAIVYSGDLVPIGNVKEFEPVEKNIPILKLKEKQAILVEAEAILGTAKEHAKWQVTSGVSYRYYREYMLPKNSALAVKFMEKAKKNVVRTEENHLVVTDIYPTPLTGELYSDKQIKYREDDTDIIFQFETDGSLKAREVLEFAIARIQTRLENIKNTVTG